MGAFKTLDDVDVRGKKVLLRVDLNVPFQDGKISDSTRIERVIPTIRELANAGGIVILLAHFGRPNGIKNLQYSLKPVVEPLALALQLPVVFGPDCIGESARSVIETLRPGEVVLLENTRFHQGEEKNDPEFAKSIAELGDIFVNDAFSAAHRAHGSTVGIANILPAFAGRAMQAELEALNAALGEPQRPVYAVVGGAKVSSKIALLRNMVSKVDGLVIGGGMANTFLAAQGKEVGKSLCEHELADTAREILAAAETANCKIILPVDAVVAREFAANAPSEVVSVEDVPKDSMILDAGPKSVAEFREHLKDARTLVWNGPLGAFEMEPFDAATVAAAQAAAKATKAGNLISVAGGGDTVAALNHAGAADCFTYISTAGGAFLEWLEGKDLPGVEALKS